MSKRIGMVMCLMVMGMVSLAWGVDGASKGYTTYDYALEHGTVKIFNFGEIKLHAYQTNDPMADECFVLETADNLIAIESPAFDNGVAEWKRYTEGLNKPLTDILLSYHIAGGRWFGGAATHATQAAKDSITDDPSRQLLNNLKGAFGDNFNTDVPEIDHILREGENSVGGVTFIITNDHEGYEIAIPAINSIYVHMLGADVHSILVSPEHIAASIAKLEGFKAKNYKLILSSHHTPETLADADTKIAYLKKTGELVAASKNAEEFMEKMKEAFPGYGGVNYLEMSAGAMFK